MSLRRKYIFPVGIRAQGKQRDPETKFAHYDHTDVPWMFKPGCVSSIDLSFALLSLVIRRSTLNIPATLRQKRKYKAVLVIVHCHNCENFVVKKTPGELWQL